MIINRDYVNFGILIAIIINNIGTAAMPRDLSQVRVHSTQPVQTIPQILQTLRKGALDAQEEWVFRWEVMIGHKNIKVF